VSSLQFFACILFVLVSASIAASEVALFSLSRFQLRSLKERIRPVTYRRIRRLLQDPGGLLVALLAVNEIVNIALSTVITGALGQGSSESWLTQFFGGVLITTPILLLFCEITPKAIGARINLLVAPLSAGPLVLIYEILKPVRFLLTRIISVFNKQPKLKENTILKEVEFLELVEEGQKQGAIHQSEVDLIKNVFELDNTTVKDVLTPISEVFPLPVSTTFRQALAAMKSSRYSRIPIVSSDRREIVGILYTKDLLKAKLEPSILDSSVSDIMRKPPVVDPGMQLNALFRKFKSQRSHMAVVRRPGGETLGIVTMNDVLESVFEDLFEDA
jgi:CBS domain containing-hemolysin-like protein